MGTPYFQNGTQRNGGQVYITCKDGRTTSQANKIINGEQYRVYTFGGGATIPDDCEAVFTITFSKDLKSLCKKGTKGSYYYSCPFSVKVSHSYKYKIIKKKKHKGKKKNHGGKKKNHGGKKKNHGGKKRKQSNKKKKL
uniref:Uncharacterized protein n=1 Tax=Strongyloides venezuelensis TaxID=75913 RepID=A0A0K0FZE1_STRVS